MIGRKTEMRDEKLAASQRLAKRRR